MNNNAPTLKTSYIPQESEFQILQVVARNAAASGLYNGVGSEQKIFMVLLAARELGIPPMQAINGGIWNIQGKIEISARLMSSMIRRAGHSIIVKHCDASKCLLEGKRFDNGDTFTAQFTIEDAARAGLTNRGPWKTYAEDMLYARAMSRLARRLFPDVIGTAYVEGEIRDAKCEVISSVLEEEVQEDLETDENRLSDFSKEFSDFDPETVKTYLKKYSSHWKKKIKDCINDYSDKEKFIKHFTIWIEKNKATQT